MAHCMFITTWHKVADYLFRGVLVRNVYELADAGNGARPHGGPAAIGDLTCLQNASSLPCSGDVLAVRTHNKPKRPQSRGALRCTAHSEYAANTRIQIRSVLFPSPAVCCFSLVCSAVVHCERERAGSGARHSLDMPLFGCALRAARL